jgi:two-component system nitrogen regulation response regulator GlnG
MAAIPRELIESELFGHERGAFTGAVQRSAGKFEQASGGTLVLDEIGDMPPEAQTRLLRVLQEGEYMTVGGRTPIKANVRIVAATHRDLRRLIQQGLFREDLFYRLNVVPIRLPPLRERLDDIPELANHYLQMATADGLPTKVLSPEAMARLKQHRWPGNVRELVNLVRRLSALYSEEIIGVETIEAELADAVSGIDHGTSPSEAAEDISLADAVDRHLQSLFAAHGDRLPPDGMYDRVISEVERPLLALALGATRGNQLRAARLLGLNRNTLRKKIKDLDVPVVRTPQVRRGG